MAETWWIVSDHCAPRHLLLQHACGINGDIDILRPFRSARKGETMMFANKVTLPALVVVMGILGQSTVNAQQSSDLEAVEATHEAYHAAFGKEDMDLMSDVWLDDQSVRLIVPPGHEIFTGWEEVKESFGGAFEDLDVISLDSRDAQTVVGESLAWIVDIHELEMRTDDGQIIEPIFFSTHIFQKVGDRWFMVQHQASAPPPSEQ
jgi:ketosteroid isomerase-like protein